MAKESVFKTNHPLLWRKIDILCHGINIDDSGLLAYYYKCQNPHETKRTGNSGLQIKLGDERIAMNVAVFKEFCKDSPYQLFKDSFGRLFIKDFRDSWFCSIYCPEEAPFWYLESVSQNEVIGDYVLLEGDFTAITSITKGCDYFSVKKPCKFCAIGAEIQDFFKRKEILINALKRVATDKQITNIHLTGGNTCNNDRGLSRYFDFVTSIRSINNEVKIAVEFSPPVLELQNSLFIKLKELGVDSITLNIEFWNDEKRKEYMPIKGMISKQDYISAFRNGLRVFGENKVSCGFIIGLENLNDTKRGIETVSSMGVVAEVYPFKPNSGSIMENLTCTETSEIIEASLFADVCMRKYRVKPYLCSGCVKCGACGITQQLAEL